MRGLHRALLDFFNSRPFSLLVLGAAVVFCACASLATYSDAVALRDHGVRTNARVTEVHDGKDSYVTLTFTTQSGQTVTADVGDYLWSPEPRVGDDPTVIYDPSDPSGNVVDARLGPDLFLPWLIAAGGVLAMIFFVLTWTGHVDWRASARDRWGY